jgi:hypothetical protein
MPNIVKTDNFQVKHSSLRHYGNGATTIDFSNVVNLAFILSKKKIQKKTKPAKQKRNIMYQVIKSNNRILINLQHKTFNKQQKKIQFKLQTNLWREIQFNM